MRVNQGVLWCVELHKCCRLLNATSTNHSISRILMTMSVMMMMVLFQSISSGKPKYNFLNLSPPNPGWSEKTRQSMLREWQIFETDDDDNDDILWKYNIIEFNILGKWLPFSLWKLLKLLRLPWPRFFQHFISDDQVHKTSSPLIILPVLEKLQEFWENIWGSDLKSSL